MGAGAGAEAGGGEAPERTCPGHGVGGRGVQVGEGGEGMGEGMECPGGGPRDEGWGWGERAGG